MLNSQPNPQLERIADLVANRVIAYLENLKKEIVPRRLNVKQAAQYLSITTGALYHLKARREIPFVKRGRSVGFLRDDLDAWLNGDRV
jgi:excisionase family DNA binding protein